jgi:hypothetical protein
MVSKERRDYRMRVVIKRMVLLAIVFLFLVTFAYCQQEAPVAVESAGSAAMSMPSTSEGETISWVWGEVKSIDANTSELIVIYTDYQTGEEKELALSIDQETKFEGVSGLGNVRIGNTASIDYLVKDGKNIANNISIEKIGEMPEASPAKEGEASVEQAATAAIPVQ